ncbi:GDSL-type esterase/lipase family protein [Marinoscillum furvescens]|uniref:Lysophospholipase L1-like esterase n=1 Tax=Marinoscillum furvescens DSM 4134 TaxID=1122208 RepID=A0A3D9L1P9_MARFU|nr:GDSL-type esterase/lipase family protein [Marinoscillum furvescens]RED97965.1 lysophospholipase L1-like esterase [Marinoscillum furvescens DSM 4134]
MTTRRFIFSALLTAFYFLSFAQDPSRFKEEVIRLQAKNKQAAIKKPVVFAGSSSFRMWKDVATDLENDKIINNGFGGSHFSDLIFYYKELIAATNPSAIFLYEGDNDLAAGKPIDQVMADAKTLLSLIRRDFPDVPVYYVCPKPSIARWHLAETYKAFNTTLEAWTETEANVVYVDVWTPMMNKHGLLDESLFIEDDLHMNEQGYAIWTNVLTPYIEAL